MTEQLILDLDHEPTPPEPACERLCARPSCTEPVASADPKATYCTTNCQKRAGEERAAGRDNLDRLIRGTQFARGCRCWPRGLFFDGDGDVSCLLCGRRLGSHPLATTSANPPVERDREATASGGRRGSKTTSRGDGPEERGTPWRSL